MTFDAFLLSCRRPHVNVRQAKRSANVDPAWPNERYYCVQNVDNTYLPLNLSALRSLTENEERIRKRFDPWPETAAASFVFRLTTKKKTASSARLTQDKCLAMSICADHKS